MLSTLRRPASAPGSLVRLARNISGMAAIEFALILPVMLLIYLGGFDVMHMVRAADKVESTSKTLADLVAQEQTNSANPASDIATLIQASAIAAIPYNNANLTVTVSAIDLKLNNGVCCVATVNWSVTQGGTLRPCSTTLRQIGPTDPWAINTIPAKIGSQGIVLVGSLQTYVSSAIVTDVSYAYTGITPTISNLLARTLWRHSYAIPRIGGQVTLTSTSGLASGQTGIICQ